MKSNNYFIANKYALVYLNNLQVTTYINVVNNNTSICKAHNVSIRAESEEGGQSHEHTTVQNTNKNRQQTVNTIIGRR